MYGNKIILNATDTYFTANPEISLIKQNYKRHTNFAKSTIEIDADISHNKVKKYNFGEKIYYSIDKISDLLLNLSIEIDIEGSEWTNTNIISPETIFNLIDSIELTVGDIILQKEI